MNPALNQHPGTAQYVEVFAKGQNSLKATNGNPRSRERPEILFFLSRKFRDNRFLRRPLRIYAKPTLSSFSLTYLFLSFLKPDFFFFPFFFFVITLVLLPYMSFDPIIVVQVISQVLPNESLNIRNFLDFLRIHRRNKCGNKVNSSSVVYLYVHHFLSYILRN